MKPQGVLARAKAKRRAARGIAAPTGPSALERWARRQRAKQSFSSGASKFSFIKRLKRQIDKQNLVPTTAWKLTRWAGYLALVLVVGGATYYVTGPAAEVPTSPRTTTAALPSTTEALPTTVVTEPPLPPADPKVCQAREVVLSNLLRPDEDADSDSLIVGLGLMRLALGDLIDVDGHPEIATAAALIEPALAEAIDTVASNPSEGRGSLANSRLSSDPEVARSIDVLVNSPLNCSAG